jgi:hypothetical protein
MDDNLLVAPGKQTYQRTFALFLVISLALPLSITPLAARHTHDSGDEVHSQVHPIHHIKP